MGLKEILFNKNIKENNIKNEYEDIKSNKIGIESISLDNKLNDFIKWYYQNFVKGYYTNIGEYYFPKKMKDFIEKMAVWYELRYPDYEVNRLMHCCGQEEIKINDVMFKNNQYVNDLLDEDSDINELDWNGFYNAHSFIKSLSGKEKWIFLKPRYKSIVYLDSNDLNTCLYLTKNGFVEKSEGISIYTDFKIIGKKLIGMHIKDVINLFESQKIKLPKNNELEKEVNKVEKQKELKEEMLNSVMYRIIERGGNRIGPRRAFLFAKEFQRNIDIPMMYGIDFSDPGLRLFINEYIKAGGREDLECYIDYYSKKAENLNVDTISIKELLLKCGNNCIDFYTPEEKELHEKFVNILNTQIDHTLIEKEKVKELRLQRKLDKSKNNMGGYYGR